jgi:trimeric autotransporter adhesin
MSNTTGAQNTATGVNTLVSNTTGVANTATGLQALDSNTSGSLNTATGFDALDSNTTGRDETATGANALFKNTIGQNNTAVGVNVLFNNTTGSNNIALGTNAGTNLTTGSNNIDIGNAGVAAESKSIRLGTQGTQTTTFIAGISGSPVSGTAVVVSATGKLGIVGSSARFKRNIRDIGSRSSGLLKLRPVTFSYKNDPTDTLQYGLVAEEVARVYPELVSYGADGKVESVNYLTLSAMLLNELKKEYNVNQIQADQLKGQAELIKGLSTQLSEVKTSARQQVVELKAGQERNLAVIQERLSALEQAMHARIGNPDLMATFNN